VEVAKLMSKAIVRCRCGHQVLAKEVLRTDLYERPTGREYVYVKYRCRRCKRMGEAFVAESRWDWSILEPQHDDMSDAERDLFVDKEPVSELDVREFQYELQDIHYLSDLDRLRASEPETPAPEAKAPPSNPTSALNGNRKRGGPEDRRRQGANEEKRSEDSSSTAT
jgi:DNA-directed RNA polymerase subunit RPC12/RpoP